MTDIEKLIEEKMREMRVHSCTTKSALETFMTKGFWAQPSDWFLGGAMPYAVHYHGHTEDAVKAVLTKLFGPHTQPVINGRYYLHPDNTIYFRSEADRTMFLLKVS